MKQETRNLVISLVVTLVLGVPAFCESVGIHANWPLIWSVMSTYLAPVALIVTGYLAKSVRVSSEFARKDDEVAELKKQVKQLRKEKAENKLYIKELESKNERLNTQLYEMGQTSTQSDTGANLMDEIDRINEIDRQLKQKKKFDQKMKGIMPQPEFETRQ